MKNKSITLIILLVGLLIISFFLLMNILQPKNEGGNGEEFQKIPLENVTYCEVNEDCIRIIADCCGCNAMGYDIPINKKYEDYWWGKLSNECSKTMCLTAFNTHWTCRGDTEVKCINNKCEFFNAEFNNSN